MFRERKLSKDEIPENGILNKAGLRVKLDIMGSSMTDDSLLYTYCYYCKNP